MKKMRRAIKNMNGMKSLMKGIGKEHTVQKNAAKHKIPSAEGADAPLTFKVTKAEVKTPNKGLMIIIMLMYK